MASSSWRLQAKNLSLTYPQCETTKEAALSRVVEYFGDNLHFAVVAQEEHAEEGTHLHMAISLKKQLRTRNCHLLDVLVDPPKHGNYQAARAMRRWVAYVVKDGQYATVGIDVKAYLEAAKMKQSTKLTLAATMLQQGNSIDAVDDEMPGLVLQHLRRLEDYHRYQKLKRERDGGLPQGALTFLEGAPSTYNDAIATWLQVNVLCTRSFKDPQLYVCGAPNSGKTSLILKLEQEGLRVYRMPYDGKWYDLYEDGMYDIIVLDEFNGQKKIQDLNFWLEGGPMMVPRRGLAPYAKKDNLPVLILSNYTPFEAYNNCTEARLAPFLARLQVITLPPDSFIDIQIEDTETLYDSE